MRSRAPALFQLRALSVRQRRQEGGQRVSRGRSSASRRRTNASSRARVSRPDGRGRALDTLGDGQAGAPVLGLVGFPQTLHLEPGAGERLRLAVHAGLQRRATRAFVRSFMGLLLFLPYNVGRTFLPMSGPICYPFVPWSSRSGMTTDQDLIIIGAGGRVSRRPVRRARQPSHPGPGRAFFGRAGPPYRRPGELSGFPGPLNGYDFTQKMEEQARKFGAEVRERYRHWRSRRRTSISSWKPTREPITTLAVILATAPSTRPWVCRERRSWRATVSPTAPPVTALSSRASGCWWSGGGCGL